MNSFAWVPIHDQNEGTREHRGGGGGGGGGLRRTVKMQRREGKEEWGEVTKGERGTRGGVVGSDRGGVGRGGRGGR